MDGSSFQVAHEDWGYIKDTLRTFVTKLINLTELIWNNFDGSFLWDTVDWYHHMGSGEVFINVISPFRIRSPEWRHYLFPSVSRGVNANQQLFVCMYVLYASSGRLIFRSCATGSIGSMSFKQGNLTIILLSTLYGRWSSTPVGNRFRTIRMFCSENDEFSFDTIYFWY